MSGLHRIFVYGTLKRGGRNHRLLSRARFMVTTHTLLRFTMVSCGPYPAIVADGRREIHGEVYEVSEETLEALDRLEDYPSLYDRIEVPLADGGTALTYVMRPEDAEGHPEIPEGRWATLAERSGRSEEA